MQELNNKKYELKVAISKSGDFVASQIRHLHNTLDMQRCDSLELQDLVYVNEWLMLTQLIQLANWLTQSI